MKKFVVRILGFAFTLLTLVCVCMALRIWSVTDDVREAMRLEPEVRYLFLGDSHIGCSIAEGPQVAVYWNSVSAPVFTLIRLLELERLGQLDNVRYCVTEVGWQTYVLGDPACLKERAGTLAPLVWRYPSLLPVDAYGAALWALLMGRETWYCEPVPKETIPFVSRDIQGASGHPDKPRWIEQLDGMEQEKVMEWHILMLDAIAAVCKRNRIRFIVFSSPVMSSVRDAVSSDAAQRRSRLIESLREHKVPYFDLTEMMPDDRFRDQDHMLPSAAAVFTPRLLDFIAAIPSLKD